MGKRLQPSSQIRAEIIERFGAKVAQGALGGVLSSLELVEMIIEIEKRAGKRADFFSIGGTVSKLTLDQLIEAVQSSE